MTHPTVRVWKQRIYCVFFSYPERDLSDRSNIFPSTSTISGVTNHWYELETGFNVKNATPSLCWPLDCVDWSFAGDSTLVAYKLSCSRRPNVTNHVTFKIKPTSSHSLINLCSVSPWPFTRVTLALCHWSTLQCSMLKLNPSTINW